MAISSGIISPGKQVGPAIKPPQADTRITTDAAHQAGIKTQGKDYDTIMEGYKAALTRANDPNNPLRTGSQPLKEAYLKSLQPGADYNYQDISPQGYSYSSTGDVTDAMSKLKDLSETGGYTAQGIQELRARGVSPIRAVYANMRREMDRRRSIQGGYMPGYAAAATRMGREAGELVAKQTSDVNAGIAEQVARNKLTAAPAYGNLAATESGRYGEASFKTSDAKNAAAQQNAANRLAAADMNQRRQLEAQSGLTGLLNMEYGGERDTGNLLQGMTSLYGTTPALAQLYGSQMNQERDYNLDVAKEKARQTAEQQAREDSTRRRPAGGISTYNSVLARPGMGLYGR